MDVLRQKMSSLAPHARKHKVTVVGSGNWGSVISKVVAENVMAHPDLFEPKVHMWVYEEEITLPKTSKHYDASSHLCAEKQPLTKLINHFHENIKYLPGIALPKNIVANPSVVDAVKDSTILIFNLPHQFIGGVCKQLKGHIVPFARGISCIKGVDVHDNHVGLFSESIGAQLGIYCGALSGANLANEIAQEKFSETTIAYDPPPMDSQAPTPAQSAGPSPTGSQVDLTEAYHKDSSGKESKVRLSSLPSDYHPIDHQTLKALFHRPYFHVRLISDVAGVSLGGALKNIVAVAAGFVDGLGWGDNAKAAIMRVGLLEMVAFGKKFFANTVNVATFTEESAGVADLITTCSGGRNHRCAKLSVERGISIEEVEAQELNGQKIQGTLTAIEVNKFLKTQGLEKEFPLFTAVYEILQGNAKPQDLPQLIEPSQEKYPALGSQDTALETNETIHSPSDGLPDSTDAPSSDKSPPKSIPAKRKFNPSIIPPHPLSTSRYARQVLLPQISIAGHERLSDARVLVIGLGGLGCPAALYLASAGVGKLGLLDSDTVELSNLHRQVLHREDSVGWTKVRSAIRGLRDINSEIEYVGYEQAFTPSNAVGITKDYDILLDCTDNPQTRYLINDVAVACGKTVVSAAAQRMEGQCMLLNYPIGVGPCYRCIFPRSPKADMVVSCEEVGVLGTAVGTMGLIMAGETIRILVQGDQGGWGRTPSMLLYNAWAETIFRNVRLRGKRKGCIACGDSADLKSGENKITAEEIEGGKVDYVAFCGTREDVNVLNSHERISSTDLLGLNGQSDTTVVVDVREPHEYALGGQIRSSINVPISQILRAAGTAGQVGAQLWSLVDDPQSEVDSSRPDRSMDLPPPKLQDQPVGRSLLFVCQKGNDSQIAAKKFIDSYDHGSKGQSWNWIGDVKGGIDAVLRHSQVDQ